MKTMQLACGFLLIVSGIAVGQEFGLKPPNIVGRWLVAESWDVSLNEHLQIAKSDVLPGFDNIWIFSGTMSCP